MARSTRGGAACRASGAASGSGSGRARGGRAGGGGRGGRGGRGSGGRGGHGGRRVGYIPYEAPVFGPTQSLAFDSRNGADWNEALLDTPGIESIRFGGDFSVKDEHLLAIAVRPALGASLKSLSLGDADTGTGGSITNAGVVSLVTACPHLRVLTLDAAIKINDATLLKCCEACPSLERLRITGHDRVTGAVTGTSLKKLKTSQELAPQLKELVLYDQSENGVEALSKARRTLAIKVGRTMGDSMRAKSTGDCEVLFTYMGGKMVGIDI
ncbi:hypothetical protein DXG01_015830 [Tephrocybe rancida]|nr:hypothetical protein DXG01_015830 [Tephrocybe rancida]